MPEQIDLTLNRADYANILALLSRVSFNGKTEAEIAFVLKAKLVKAIDEQPIDPEVVKKPKKGKSGNSK